MVQGLTSPGQTYQFTWTVDGSSNPINVSDILNLMANGNVRRADSGAVPVAVMDSVAVDVSYPTVSVASLSASSWVIVYQRGVSEHIYAVVCTISGSVVTVGAPVDVSGAAITAATATVAALSSSSFIVTYAASVAKAVVCTVSGTVITPGTPTTVVNYAVGWLSIAALSANVAVAAYSNSSNNVRAIILSISGTTITANTDTSVAAVGVSFTGGVAALSGSLFAIGYIGAANCNAVACTVSGTTITPGAVATINSSSNSSNSLIAPLDATHFVVAFNDTNGYPDANVCSVSGTTITSGTTSVLMNSAATTAGLTAINSTTFVVALPNPAIDATKRYLQGIICTQSGSVITPGALQTLISDSINTTIAPLAALDSTHFVAGFVGANSKLVYTAYEAFSGTTLTNPGVSSANTVGMAATAALPGQQVLIAGTGIIPNLSGLATASGYWWDRIAGQLWPGTADDVVGIALNPTTMLISAGSGNQWFG